MKHRAILLLLGLAAASLAVASPLAAAGEASVSAVADPTCPHPGSGTLRGRAFRAGDGSALQAGTVRIYDENLCSTASASVVGGNWVVEGLAAGSYYVTIDAAVAPSVNLVRMLYPNIVCPDLREQLHLACGTAGGRLMAVAEGQIVFGIDFYLQTGAKIQGQVRDAASGEPLAGALLELRRPEDAHPLLYLEAAADGTYAAAGLAGGSYLLSARTLEHSTEVYGGVHCLPHLAECRAAAEVVTVALGEERGGIDFRLDALGAVAGTILDEASRAPLAGVLVEAFAIDGSGRYGFAESDGSGRYSMPNLTAENFYIVANHPGYRKEVFADVPFAQGLAAGRLVAVHPGETTSGIDFDLTLLGSLSGRVSARSGAAVERCTVYLWKVGDNGWDPPPIAASCADDGSFTAIGLEAGSYWVGVNHVYPFAPAIYGIGSCNWEIGTIHCDLAQATPVVVRNGETSGGIEIEIELGGRIAGRVDLSGDPVGTAPAQVLLYQDDGRLAGVRFLAPHSPPEYEFFGLAPGRYRLTAAGGSSWRSEALGGASCSRWYCPPSRSAPVDVAAAGLFSGADFALERIGAYAGCTPSADKLCLNAGRFEVEATWRDFLGQTGTAAAVPFNDLTGSFTFFSENNIEVVVKALNGCSSYLGHRLWIFGAGLTNVEVELRVRDTVTGARKTYSNALGHVFAPLLDTAAFDTCDALEPPSSAVAAILSETPAPAVPTPCRDDASGRSLCLAEGRFRVAATFEERSSPFPARAQFLSADTVAFSFFDDDNLELMVKVLDACSRSQPGHWIFVAGLTDVETAITVEDVLTGETREYRSGPGPFAPIYDFATFGAESCSRR